MTVESDIATKENEAIEELRKRMKDVLDPDMYEDEHLLRRFLKARDYNVNNAEAMLRKNLEWRATHDLKNIMTYKKPEVIEKYLANVIIGYDKEGCVIRYCPVGNCDFIGMNASCKFEDTIRIMIYEAETDTMELKKQSKKLGRNIDKCVYIYNLAHLSFAQATDKRNIYQMIYLLKFFQNNYPERLKSAFILNSSIYFTMMYNTLKPVLAQSILEKIHIYSDDSYQKDLLKIIDAEVLPAFLGGTKTDPDGNPLCNSIVNHGGKVPESYYLQKSKKSLAKAPGVVKVTLPRAAFYEVNLEVEEPNSFLEWEFETKCRDIGFGLFHQEVVDGEETNAQIIPIHRIDTELSAETGTFLCNKVGSYVLVFDNTYSWIRSKEIFYRIKVVTPKEHEAQVVKD